MSGRIVVGVDGSVESRRALEFGYEEARRRGATVDVVYAYSLPTTMAMPGYMGPVDMPPIDELAQDAKELMARLVESAPRDLEIQTITARGPAARTLLDVARGADLLVVGSRGRGGFRGLLLGSTSHQAISHAPCPVVVVPTARDA
ncbi:MAG TPA: universal stress protein [Nitriliruptoraceae bacterium]|nr:universal stress protein [Nitriliruptoraceae bacterium]